MSATQHVLVVEDEPKIAQLLIDYLQANHYQTTWLDNGTEVVSWVQNNNPDMVLLDLMLPGKDGLEICREIRAFSEVPLMIITARVEELDRILGLELGADDYICKPFSPREVMTRIKNLLRRTNQKIQTTQQSLFTLDIDRFEAHYADQKLELTQIEFRLLETLSKRQGHVYSRQQLIDNAYQDHRIVTDRTIDTHIKNLRKKIQEAGGDAEIIRSIYGVGYKFEG